MMAAERLVADGHGEKAGETEGFVVARSFQVAPHGLRSDIDAKHRLGLRSNLGIAWEGAFARRSGGTPARGEFI